LWELDALLVVTVPLEFAGFDTLWMSGCRSNPYGRIGKNLD